MTAYLNALGLVCSLGCTDGCCCRIARWPQCAYYSQCVVEGIFRFIEGFCIPYDWGQVSHNADANGNSMQTIGRDG